MEAITCHCGFVVTEPYCCKCGNYFGINDLEGLAEYIRGQRREGEKHFSNMGEMDSAAYIKSITRWKRWENALQELLEKKLESE